MPLDYGLLAVFALSVAALGVMLYFFVRSSERVEPSGPGQPRLITVIKCEGGQERSREYREGDYVGLSTDECPNGVVVGIYREVQQR